LWELEVAVEMEIGDATAGGGDKRRSRRAGDLAEVLAAILSGWCPH
jgi:hypothetical protein